MIYSNSVDVQLPGAPVAFTTVNAITVFPARACRNSLAMRRESSDASQFILWYPSPGVQDMFANLLFIFTNVAIFPIIQRCDWGPFLDREIVLATNDTVTRRAWFTETWEE